MMQNKVLSLLGIAMRGHNLVSGELQTVEAIKNGSACLVIIAGDASGNSRTLYSDKSSFYQIPYVLFGTKEQLGKAIGKDERSAVAVCDAGLARAIQKHLGSHDTADSEFGGMNGENKNT